MLREEGRGGTKERLQLPGRPQKLGGWQVEVAPAKSYKQEGNSKVVVPDH